MGQSTIHRRKKSFTAAPPPPMDSATTSKVSAAKKKGGGSRLWMRMDRIGHSELIECDKSVIVKRVSVPSRDLRILGPIFSHSSSILAREKAMIVNLEFIRAIVTAEEVLLLDPLCQEVLPFVDQLRRQLPQSNSSKPVSDQIDNNSRTPIPRTNEDELPFEFQVLEIALEVVCTYLDSNVAELERDAYPALDDLAVNVSTKNLEHVRSLKSNLTRLLARVQKILLTIKYSMGRWQVRDEIEHLLDDNEDMAQLYLTRKWIQNEASNGSIVPDLRRLSSTRSGSLVSNYCYNEKDVEDLEMLLEAYFTQLDGTRNKILSVREYIDDTEDYINIQLDNQRNELIQLQLIMSIASFAIAVETSIAGIFGMNIPCTLYNVNGIFLEFVGIVTAACIALFFLVLGYARWKKLIGS